MYPVCNLVLPADPTFAVKVLRFSCIIGPTYRNKLPNMSSNSSKFRAPHMSSAVHLKVDLEALVKHFQQFAFPSSVQDLCQNGSKPMSTDCAAIFTTSCVTYM